MHPAINQVLRCIYNNLQHLKFDEKGCIDIHDAEGQRPDIIGSTLEILDFINTLAFKVKILFAKLNFNLGIRRAIID